MSASPDEKIAVFHDGLLERYPKVDHISSAELNRWSKSEVLLFDVRPLEEFEVSHLKGAIRVDPNIDGREFIARFGAQLADKKAVFYCSVGERSSKLVEAIIGLAEDQSYQMSNLEGGLFKWHNEFRPVYNGIGPTSKIHPFNRYWGRLLMREKDISKK